MSASSAHAPVSASRSPGLESFSYDDAIVRKFLLATVVFGVVAMLVGVIVAIQLAFPQANVTEYGSFGRLRPLHTNAAIFAFAGNAIFAAVYYSTQRLCKSRMWSDKLSNLHFWGWQAIIVAAAITLPMGITQGKEYAELEWPIDLAIAVVWVGFFGVNFFMTLKNRRERHMYVALWFYIATIVTVAVLHVGNSMSLPLALVELAHGRMPSGSDWMKSWSMYAGAQDAMMQWWYGHNAVAFFLTTPFLGLMYYFVPKAANRPVYSYRLSIVHFWSLVFIYIWAGPHHLHYTAIPNWASTLGMIFSVMLWMPSWGGMINGLLTLRVSWRDITSVDPIIRFFILGVTFYGMSTFEGPLLSIKSVNALSHYTDWTIAHVHSGALGWNGMMTFGMLYWLLPRVFQTKLWSTKLMAAHFWTATIGILLYVIAIYTAGITQGLMWRAFTENGELQYPNFLETVLRLMPMYWIRVLGGTLFLSGMILAGVNMFMTWRTRPSTYDVPVHEAAPLSATFVDPPVPTSRLEANTDFAKEFDSKVIQGWFHRVWERKPMKFTVLTIAAVLVASLFELIPTLLVGGFIPKLAQVKPYTPLELAGRDVYIAEGCYNCHSQMIRSLFAETERYGEFSRPGESQYDHPFQWGSRRIGPDLAREGLRQSASWQADHLYKPQDLSAGSIMPAYPHLFTQDLNFDAIQSRVNSMAMLGVPYGDMIKETNATEHARIQAKELAQLIAVQGSQAAADGKKLEDKRAIALVAYLMRLGVDFSKPAPAETPAVADQPGVSTPATPSASSDAPHHQEASR